MNGVRPQRLISESSTNSSRETDGTKTQNCDENMKTTTSTSALGCRSEFQRNHNMESRTIQTSHDEPRKQHDERKRRPCSRTDSLARSEHNKFELINEKEKPIVQDAIKTNHDEIYVEYQTKGSTLACPGCSEVSNDEADVFEDGSASLSNKANGASRHCFCQHSNGIKGCQEKPQEQLKCTTACHHHQPEDETDLSEASSSKNQRQYASLVNNPDADYSKSQVEHDMSENSSQVISDKKKNVLKDLKERDDIINDYQLQEMMCHKAIKQKLDEDYSEIRKLRKNYSSLKKLFLALATLNIVLILFVVSAMPVILVTFKLSGDNDIEDIERISAKHLSSTEAKIMVMEHVLCVDCNRIKEHWSDIFTRESGKGCCLEDVASLVDRVFGFNEKKLKDIHSMVNRKIRKNTNNLMEDFSALEAVVFNETFNSPNSSATRPLLRRQIRDLSRLVNTLLTRKRSALHLSGTVRHHALAWSQDFPKTSSGPLIHRNNNIQVISGGVYFMYSCIRFNVGKCYQQRKVKVGYQIVVNNGGQNKTLAAVQYLCKDGQYNDTDLIIQKIVHVPVNDKGVNTTLHIINYSQDLVSHSHSHSFGLFEI